MGWKEWFRPPRHLLILFLGITAVSAATLAWLSWQLVRQDRALAAQRAQERRENAATLAVAALQKRLSEIEEQLTALAALPDVQFPQKAEEYSRNLPPDSVLVILGPSQLKAYPAGRLLYYPAGDEATEETGSDEFSGVDILEFRQKDFPGTIAELEKLARSSNPRIHAQALVRLGRTLRKAGRWEDAIKVYEQLSNSARVTVQDIPSDLLGRGAICDLLAEHGAGLRLHHEASALYRDLHSARWHLTRPVYDVYAERLRRVLGAESAPAPVPQILTIAEAAQVLWRARDTDKAGQTRQTLWAADRPAVVVTRRSSERTIALIAGSDYVATFLTETPDATIVLTDTQDHPVVGHIEHRTAAYAVRLPSVSGVPWTVYALSSKGSTSTDAFSFRSRLVLAGLSAIALLVIGGSYLIARAVARELAVARLQSDFVTAVSHEFRTPLTAMRQLSELLAKGRVPNDDIRQQYYDVLEHESSRLQRLVEGLLKFGRMEAGAMRYQFEHISPAELVHSTVEEFRKEAERRRCRVEFSAKTPLPRVRADREALACVIWNLMDNAVKYSPDRNCIWVAVDSANGGVAISVRDEGVGISRQDRQRIFRKFVRGQVAGELGIQGAGIGLAVAREIIATHAGEIRVESELGVGSRFTILLPGSAS